MCIDDAEEVCPASCRPKTMLDAPTLAAALREVCEQARMLLQQINETSFSMKQLNKERAVLAKELCASDLYGPPKIV